MTLDDMRTLVRIRTDDRNNQKWTDNSVIDVEINNGAAYVSREISKHQRVNYFAASESFTTSGSTLAYALAATNVRRIFKMFRVESTYQQPAREIRETDKLDSPLLTDQVGNWLYYLTRDRTTKLWSVNFPYIVPSGMNFTVQYIARTPAITVGGAGTQEFTDLDEDYHEMVVQRAVIMLLGPDQTTLQPAIEYYNELRSQMFDDLHAGTDGDQVQDEFQRC